MAALPALAASLRRPRRTVENSGWRVSPTEPTRSRADSEPSTRSTRPSRPCTRAPSARRSRPAPSRVLAASFLVAPLHEPMKQQATDRALPFTSFTSAPLPPPLSSSSAAPSSARRVVRPLRRLPAASPARGVVRPRRRTFGSEAKRAKEAKQNQSFLARRFFSCDGAAAAAAAAAAAPRRRRGHAAPRRLHSPGTTGTRSCSAHATHTAAHGAQHRTGGAGSGRPGRPASAAAAGAGMGLGRGRAGHRGERGRRRGVCGRGGAA